MEAQGESSYENEGKHDGSDSRKWEDSEMNDSLIMMDHSDAKGKKKNDEKIMDEIEIEIEMNIRLTAFRG